MTPQTPSQTVGPFFAMALARDGDEVLTTEQTPGERIRIVGRLLDGAREPIEDGLVEIWQADADGRYRHPLDGGLAPSLDGGLAPSLDGGLAPSLDDGFTGFGRARTGFEDGTFAFDTVRPGRVPTPDGRLQAPHVSVVVQARGMLNPCFTRLYFGDEEVANAEDPVLASVPEHRRATLLAVRDDAPVPTYRLDIRFQGDDETVFLDW